MCINALETGVCKPEIINAQWVSWVNGRDTTVRMTSFRHILEDELHDEMFDFLGSSQYPGTSCKVKLDEPQPLAMLTLLAVPVQDGKFSLICDPMHKSLSYVNV